MLSLTGFLAASVVIEGGATLTRRPQVDKKGRKPWHKSGPCRPATVRLQILHGRAGLVFDARYATGRVGDPAVVPALVRECLSAEFVSVIELSLESGDECWFGEIATRGA